MPWLKLSANCSGPKAGVLGRLGAETLGAEGADGAVGTDGADGAEGTCTEDAALVAVGSAVAPGTAGVPCVPNAALVKGFWLSRDSTL